VVAIDCKLAVQGSHCEPSHLLRFARERAKRHPLPPIGQALGDLYREANLTIPIQVSADKRLNPPQQPPCVLQEQPPGEPKRADGHAGRDYPGPVIDRRRDGDHHASYAARDRRLQERDFDAALHRVGLASRGLSAELGANREIPQGKSLVALPITAKVLTAAQRDRLDHPSAMWTVECAHLHLLSKTL